MQVRILHLTLIINMNTDLMFSSKTEMWATPQDFFNQINKEYNFSLDVCAIDENAKCSNYYTPEIDGLKQEWKGNCWMNPPYGREIGKWIEKAYYESIIKNNCIVVALLPARTDTKWFHNYIYMKERVKINFIKGRLKFGNGKNPAPFPSMIVIFK
jgi:phage N-6-adenine-methyltransferase